MAAETTPQSKKRIIFWTLAASLVVVLLVFGLRSWLKTEVPVRVASPTYQDMTTVISTNGIVEPIQDFVAHAPFTALVKSVRGREGEAVSAGTLLVSLDASGASARVAAANSALVGARVGAENTRMGGTQEERIALSGDLQRAQLQVSDTERDLNALKALQARGAASPSEVAATQARLDTARSNLTSLQQRQTQRFSASDRARTSAQIAETSAALNDAQHMLAQSSVRAPFDGIVYALPVKQSDWVNPGDILARVADLSRMRVRAYFDEPEIGKLAVGQAVVITWEAKLNRIWHGRVVQVPSTIHVYGTRNVGEAIIEISDAKDDLLPSTNVNVKVTTLEKPHVLAVPREGLRTEGSQSYVLRVVNGKLVKTPVKIGAVNLTSVEITSGISTNDTIALNATTTADLEDGLNVKVVK